METALSPAAYKPSKASAFAFPYQSPPTTWEHGSTSKNGRCVPNRQGTGFCHESIPSPTLPGIHAASPVTHSSEHHSVVFTVSTCPKTLAGKFPLSWSRNDVEEWLKWCVEEFSLGGVEVQRFCMNGKALCLLTKEGFQHRAPYAGDVLHDLLHKSLRRGPHFYQSVPSMQMKPSDVANDAISLGRHLCSKATTINTVDGHRNSQAYDQEWNATDQSCFTTPRNATSIYRLSKRYDDMDVTPNRYEDEKETAHLALPLPLNLKKAEGASESSSDSGCSSQDAVEERESHSAHPPLAASWTYSDSPEVTHPRRSPPGHGRTLLGGMRSPIEGQRRRSSLVMRGRSRSPSLAEEHIRQSVSSPPRDGHPTSATKSDQFQAYHAACGQASPVPAPHVSRWASSRDTPNHQHLSVSSFLDYKFNKDGELAVVMDGRSHRHWQREEAQWKEGYPGLKEGRDRSPAGRQKESGELFSSGAGILLKSLTGVPRYCQKSDTDLEIPDLDREVIVRAHQNVPVIRNFANSSESYSLRKDDGSISASQRLGETASKAPSFITMPGQDKRCPLPQRSKLPCSNDDLEDFPKILSGFLTQPHRHSREADSQTTSRHARCTEAGCLTGKDGSCRVQAVCRFLWDFLAQLLDDDTYLPYIRWKDKEKLVFLFIQPDVVATLWGRQKNRAKMSYEKMSRSMRYYYNTDIMCKVPGQKLTYRFLQDPKDIGNSPRFSKLKRKTSPTSTAEGAVADEENPLDPTDSEEDRELSDVESLLSNAAVTVTMETVSVETDAAETCFKYEATDNND